MTKKKLLDLLESFEDGTEIFAWWDDCIWEIQGVSLRRPDHKDNERNEEVVCLDCP